MKLYRTEIIITYSPISVYEGLQRIGLYFKKNVFQKELKLFKYYYTM